MLPWVREQIIEKLGFNPYSGTLNLRIDKLTMTCYHEIIEDVKQHRIDPPDNSYYPGLCVKAWLNYNVLGAIVIPIMPDYPKDLVEVISAHYLREKLSLNDGDELSVTLIEL